MIDNATKHNAVEVAVKLPGNKNVTSQLADIANLKFVRMEMINLKAKELKTQGIKFTLGEKEYELKLNMNTFCELEEIYGNLDAAFEDLQNMKLKAVRALIYAAVKIEDEQMTLKQVGELLGLSDLERLGTAINEALTIAMPEADEAEGEEIAT